MKKIIFIVAMISLGITFASATELSVKEKSILKIIIRQDFQSKMQYMDKQLTTRNPFWIAMWGNKNTKEKQLLKEFKKIPIGKKTKLDYAQALAYIGNKEGIEVLKQATFNYENNPYLTNSGFEMSDSALCLLYLGFDFPSNFKFSMLVNSKYPELDILLENKK